MRPALLTVILAAAVLVSGCTSQAAINHARPICRDGVEYLVYIDPGFIKLNALRLRLLGRRDQI